MRAQTKLAFLRSLNRLSSPGARKSSQGFTLVEVLVVAGILAILFAALVPNLLRARARAAASAVIQETVGVAKACQAVVASGVGTDTFGDPIDGSQVICSGADGTVGGGVSDTFTSRTWTGVVEAADNINCLNPNPALSPNDGVNVVSNGAEQVVITVDGNGNMSCSLA